MKLTDDKAFELAMLPVEFEVDNWSHTDGEPSLLVKISDGLSLELIRRRMTGETKSRLSDAIGPRKEYHSVFRSSDDRFWEFLHWNTEFADGWDVAYIHTVDEEKNVHLRELRHLRDNVYLPMPMPTGG